MRTLLIIFPAAVLLLFSLGFSGCSSDDDDSPTEVPSGSCSIEITTPIAGERFLPGAIDSQTVKIRWDKTGGTSMVNIDLLKGGQEVTRLVSGGLNSGYYSWRASNHGEEDGNDFSVRVTSDGSSSCTSTSEEFVLLNTIGCFVDFTNDLPDTLFVGDDFTFTWENVETPGLVSIEMGIRDTEPNLIATDLANNGSYTWTVESFGQGNDDRYFFSIKDTVIPDYCFNKTTWFVIKEIP